MSNAAKLISSTSRIISRKVSFEIRVFLQPVVRLLFSQQLTRRALKFQHPERLFISSLVVSAFSFGSSPRKNIMEKADEIYDSGNYEELKKYLTEIETKDDNVLWRLARVNYEMSKPLTSKDEKKKLIDEAFGHITLAMELNEENGFVHKWYAILLSSMNDFGSTKEKIERAPVIKKHLEKAISLIPNDATTIHSLGVWCYSVADISWLERQIASKLFATPPSSSYQEALKYFEQAESTSPLFYNANLLYLAKCYMKQNDNDKAKDALLKARDYPQETQEDQKIHAEAVQLLKKLGVS